MININFFKFIIGMILIVLILCSIASITHYSYDKNKITVGQTWKETHYSYDKNKITVGQTWKETHHENDPYQKVSVYYKEVIEITGEYVLYVKNGKDTLHDSKYWFVVCSELIKK